VRESLRKTEKAEREKGRRKHTQKQNQYENDQLIFFTTTFLEERKKNFQLLKMEKN